MQPIPTPKQGPRSFGVTVRPLFEHAAAARGEEAMAELLGTELDLRLEASAPWITTPETMVLTSAKDRGSQSFPVRLDPSQLPPGAHFGRVYALDASDAARGPLFSLPVTVVVPEPAAPAPASPVELAFALTAGEPSRRFLATPALAEWATVTIRTEALPAGPHSVILHAPRRVYSSGRALHPG